MNAMPALLVGVAAVCWPLPGLADEIWLLGDHHPHAGEVIEETPQAVIVRFPKSEVQQTRRDEPSDIRARHERRIFWQDAGDSIVLTLPKERLESSAASRDQATRQLTEVLGSVGTPKAGPAHEAVSFTGRVVGRVISRSGPLAGCKVGIVSRGSEAGLISRLFAGKKSSANGAPFFQTVTNDDGTYALEDVVVGEYDVYWQVPSETQWTRKLSETPNVTVAAGETVHYPDIHAP